METALVISSRVTRIEVRFLLWLPAFRKMVKSLPLVRLAR